LAEDSPAEAKTGRPAAFKCGVRSAECGVQSELQSGHVYVFNPQSSILNPQFQGRHRRFPDRQDVGPSDHVPPHGRRGGAENAGHHVAHFKRPVGRQVALGVLQHDGHGHRQKGCAEDAQAQAAGGGGCGVRRAAGGTERPIPFAPQRRPAKETIKTWVASPRFSASPGFQVFPPGFPTSPSGFVLRGSGPPFHQRFNRPNVASEAAGALPGGVSRRALGLPQYSSSFLAKTGSRSTSSLRAFSDSK